MKRMQTSEKNDYFDFKDTCKLNRRIFLPPARDGQIGMIPEWT